MKFSSRTLFAAAVAFLLLPVATAFGWGETQRLDGLAGLAAAPPASLVPDSIFPPEISGSARTRLRRGVQTPVRMDVAADGTIYVLSHGPGTDIFGGPIVEGRALTRDSSGRLLAPDGTPLSCEFFDAAEYLYTASLMTLHRVNPDSGAVTAVRTFLTQTETGIPASGGGVGNLETIFPPAGLAIDRTDGDERLYVSVPGRGVERLSLETGAWSTFVSDDHDTWIPQESLSETRQDGEGAESIVRCLRGDSGAAYYYGALWEGGPTVPSAIAVDPVTRDVHVSEQYANYGPGDREFYGRLVVRRFGVAGNLLPAPDFVVDSSRFPLGPFPPYPGPDATRDGQGTEPPLAPRWFLGTPFGQSANFDTRTAALHVLNAGGVPELTVLNQFESTLAQETHVGQIVISTADAGGVQRPSRVVLADRSANSFGPTEVPRRLGVVDLAVRKDSRGAWRLLVPSTSAPGLLEIEADNGTPLGSVGSSTGDACAWTNARVRLATDPRNGTILVLQQQDPAVTGSQPMILRLDPRSTGCVETTPPEEVEPTDPVVSVVGSQYEDSPEGPVPPGGGLFAFSPVVNGDTVTLDEEDAAAGWLFSVRVEDEDNQGADFGSAARCDREITVQGAGPVLSTDLLTAGACRPALDTRDILGSSGTGAWARFVVTKEQLLPEGASTPKPAALKVTVTDDEGVEADPITINIVLKTKVRAPIAIDRFEPAKAARDRFRYSMQASSFDEWQVDFGDPAGTRQPPTGFLPASSFPASSAEITYPAPGEYTATLTVRRDGGTKPEDIATKTAKVLVEAEQQQRPVTVVTPQSGAPCDTPLGIPLAQVGLGDQLLCVPADPCDVNTAELGLTKLPIVRPASCAGDDSSLFAAAEGSGPPPLGSRPIFLARTLRLSADRKIAARIRCSTGPSSCAGRVRMQLIRPGKAAATVGTTSFKELVAEKTATVSVKVSAANARLLRRTARPRVRVTVIPSVGATFTRPASHTRTVNLSAPKPRRTR